MPRSEIETLHLNDWVTRIWRNAREHNEGYFEACTALHAAWMVTLASPTGDLDALSGELAFLDQVLWELRLSGAIPRLPELKPITVQPVPLSAQ